MVGHLMLSLALASVATGVLAAGLRVPPGKSLWSVFVLLALGIWAGGLWVAPTGPVHFGINWLPYLLIAILLGVLVAALSHRGVPQSHREEMAFEREVDVGLGLFFWVLVVALACVIAAGYR